MARRFWRGVENPERRIESEGDFHQVNPHEEEPYNDMFDEVMDKYENSPSISTTFKGLHRKDSDTQEEQKVEAKKPSQREEFLSSLRVDSTSEKSPLMVAYEELDKARQSGSREDVIKAEDKILDIQRQEEVKGYNARIAELKQMQVNARNNNDQEALKRFSQLRKKLVFEMDYDEINYKISKLQNVQRLTPSRDNLQQIVELRKQLDELELNNGISK